jgi:hypothetical protein
LNDVQPKLRPDPDYHIHPQAKAAENLLYGLWQRGYYGKILLNEGARDFADFFQGNVNVMGPLSTGNLSLNHLGTLKFLFAIKWGDIDFASLTLHIRRSIYMRTMGKCKSPTEEGFAFVQIRGYGTNVLAATK